ncbi:MAG: hypothetical protein LBH44_13475 [Treponema sp.]|jgi:hypothetical protein|nr:hypothetical protein [Treponema sp.]
MAWVFGGKRFGQYTYEHWFDDEYDESKSQIATKFPAHEASGVSETDTNNTNTDKQPPPP